MSPTRYHYATLLQLILLPPTLYIIHLPKYNKYIDVVMKKPGAFSLKYMSNPLPQRTTKPFNHPNKENKNQNGTFDQCDMDFPAALSSAHTPEIKPRKLSKLQQKQQQLTQALSENDRLKKQVRLMKQQLKRYKQKNNQHLENIHNYEQCLETLNQQFQELQHANCELQQQKQKYEQELKFGILWFVEMFAIFGRNRGDHQRIVGILESRFIEHFQSLKPMVERLQIQKQLKDMYEAPVEEKEQKQDYLMVEGGRWSERCLLDTFNVREEEQQKSQDEEQIARKLFTNNPTPQSSPPKAQISEQQWINKPITILKDYQPDNEDELAVRAGDQVTLLRKISDSLWIGESANTIGYIHPNLLDI